MNSQLETMLMEGHHDLPEAEMTAALKAWFSWLDERCTDLQRTDPVGLDALLNELQVDSAFRSRFALSY